MGKHFENVVAYFIVNSLPPGGYFFHSAFKQGAIRVD
jgi:hypothetical protein